VAHPHRRLTRLVKVALRHDDDVVLALLERGSADERRSAEQRSEKLHLHHSEVRGARV
jgi:hypothetical protein